MSGSAELQCGCGRCDGCALRALAGASARLSTAYGRAVELTLHGGRVMAAPAGLPRLRPPRPPAPADARVARARALLDADDPAVRLQLERQHADEALQALCTELADIARRGGADVQLGRLRLRADLRSGRRLVVRLRAAAYTIDGRSNTLSGPGALRAAVMAELALDRRVTPPSEPHAAIERLLAGDDGALPTWQRALVDRMGVLDDAPAAKWLRDELARHLAHGPTPGGLGSPVATTGVTYASGRLLALDGIPITHVDADALAAWRVWAARRARVRQHPVTGHPLALTWRPVTWGPPGEAGARLPFARDGPESADVVFARHRRMYARQALPPVGGERPPTDWGRAGTPLPLDPPPRARGPARSQYEPIARHWLVGWSLSELARASGASRSAVDRLIRSATSVSGAARGAFERRGTCAYAGRWLAVSDGRVVVTETWSGLDESLP